MAYEWERFFYWLYHDVKAPGVVQAFAAVVTVMLTAVLVGVTAYYAGLTRNMANSMKDQLAASFQPNVRIEFTSRTNGTGFSGGQASEGISGSLSIRNQGNSMLKLVAVRLHVDFAEPRFSAKDETLGDGRNRVISPGQFIQLNFWLRVDQGAGQGRYNRSAAVQLSDLSGFSRHRFCVSDSEPSTAHYLDSSGLAR